ncbi:CD63 antigen-like isoform X4 [Lissotriton helveticus]
MLQQKLTVSFLEQTNAMRSKGGLIAAKVGLFIVIMFYLVTGIALMGLGVVCQINLSVNLVLNDGWYGAPLLLSAVGFLIFMISTFGAVAVFNEHQGMIRTFTAVLAIVVLFEILAGISAFVLRDKLSKILLKKFQKIINKYGVDDDVTEGVDTLQQKGCVSKLKVWIIQNVGFIGAIGIGIGIVQSVGIICSCCLVKLLKGNYKVL